MNILYIRKQERGPFIKRTLRLVRDSFYWHNRVGFFCASLRTQADVTRKSLETIQGFSKEQFKVYDVIIFNYECNFSQTGDPIHTSCNAVRALYEKISDIPKVLLISSPNAKLVPKNEDMDLFDMVFRREHFKDLDQYDLTTNNKDKLRTTVLSCPLIPANIFNYSHINAADYGYEEPSTSFDHDVFFLGQETSKTFMRTNIVERVKKADINFTGGIHPDVRNPQREIPEDLYAPRLSKKRFYEQTRSSKINLALEGYGQFTYRHWECWALSSFMISSPSVNDVKLPFEIVDGKHFATFTDKNDLIDKIHFYLHHPGKREEIIHNGRELYKKEYNFQKHGKYIVESLRKIV
jgi:hypothetical protein